MCVCLCKGMVTVRQWGSGLWWEVVLDQRHLSGSGCNWLQYGVVSLIWGPGEGDSQANFFPLCLVV